MWCAADNHNYTIICVTNVQNDFKIRTFIKQVLTKYQIFKKIAPNFTFSQKIQIFKVYLA